MEDPRYRTGTRGEVIAAFVLTRHGARVVGRNVMVEDGEVDLVVDIAGERVAVEVRTRWNEDPLDAFDDTKLDRVRRSASRLSPPCRRIDLVTVHLSAGGAEVRWLRDL